MRFYHNYLISKKIKQANVDINEFRKNYNLEGFTVEQISDFFDNYSDVENLRVNHLLYFGNTTEKPEKILRVLKKYEKKYSTLAGQLYIASLPNIENFYFAKKNVSYFMKSSYFNVLKNRNIDLFVNDKSYLDKAVLDNDYDKVDYLLNKGLTVKTKLNILPHVGKILHPLMLSKLLDYDLVDLSNKNQTPSLDALMRTKYPIKKMISRGFKLEHIPLVFNYNYRSISNPVNEAERRRQEMYVELVEAGLNPNIPLADKHMPLFYITHIDLIKRLIKSGLDINYKEGYKSIVTDIIFNSVYLEEDKKRNAEIVDFLLGKGATLGEKQSKGIIKDKVCSLEKIRPELYPVLLKHNIVNYDSLVISINNLNNNAKILAPLILKGKLKLENIMVDDFENLNSINPNIFSVMINNIKDINVKTPNGNTIAEQFLIENMYGMVKDKIQDNLILSGNKKFKDIFGVENGKITYFENVYDEEMYDFLKSKKMLGVATRYPVEKLSNVMYPIGKKAFEDGYINDAIINPVLNEFKNPFKSALCIYAIENKNLNLIKDKEGNNLLTKVYSLDMAKKLIENNIEIQLSPKDYAESIREYITEQFIMHEKELLLESIDENNKQEGLVKKKRL